MCPGQRVEWVLISSPRTAPCPPLPPAPTTKSRITTTTTCSSTPSAPLQTLPPSSLPQVAQLATGRLTTITRTTTEPPPPPPSTTATTAACLGASPYPLRPAPAVAPFPDRSETPSCLTLRCCRRPTANLRLLPRHHHCPPPQSLLPTSPAWEGCPSWCLRRTRQVLWCETKQNIFISKKRIVHVFSRLGLMKRLFFRHTHTHTFNNLVNFLLCHSTFNFLNITFCFFIFTILSDQRRIVTRISKRKPRLYRYVSVRDMCHNYV